MGDRINITIRNSNETSPTLHCHWLGLNAIECVHNAIRSSNGDPSNILCNTLILAMDGETHNSSFHLCGDAECIDAGDNGNWTWNTDTNVWEIDVPWMPEKKTVSMREALFIMDWYESDQHTNADYQYTDNSPDRSLFTS
jgi:hypothetical protein